jgi:galactose mutarotase-like enzyme
MNRREMLFSMGVGASSLALRRGAFSPSIPVHGNSTIRESIYKDTSSYVIETEVLRAEFVAAGGRMVSLQDRRIGHEFLFQQTEAKYVRGNYDVPMALNEAAGYDDMFPTISECFNDTPPWSGIRMPDHGEVWSLDWNVEKSSDSLSLSVHGVRLPYRFSRKVTFPEPNRLRMAYTLENLSPFVMPYLWSAHAMLRPEEGARILLPEQCRVATVGSSHSGRLGKYGDRITWPNWTDAHGVPHDLSKVRSPTTDDVEAYTFADRLSHGMCGLQFPSIKRTLRMSFPVETVPFMTVLVGEGLKTDPRFFVLLEPCSAPFGRLDTSRSYSEDSAVAKSASREWYLDFMVETS